MHGAPFQDHIFSGEKKTTHTRGYEVPDTSRESTLSKNLEPTLDAIRSVMRGTGEMTRVRDCVLELQSVKGRAISLSPALNTLLEDVIQIGVRLIGIDIQSQKS